jgi:hypothetical protein
LLRLREHPRRPLLLGKPAMALIGERHRALVVSIRYAY